MEQRFPKPKVGGSTPLRGRTYHSFPYSGTRYGTSPLQQQHQRHGRDVPPAAFSAAGWSRFGADRTPSPAALTYIGATIVDLPPPPVLASSLNRPGAGRASGGTVARSPPWIIFRPAETIRGPRHPGKAVTLAWPVACLRCKGRKAAWLALDNPPRWCSLTFIPVR
jgi:hypothetical protein